MGGIGSYGETIELRAGLALYGGFQGVEVVLKDRDWKRHDTVVSANSSGRSVVTVEERATDTTRLDGFTIEFGFAPQGGGIFVSNASHVIVHNLIRNNVASHHKGGAGIFCHGGSVLIRSSRLEFNEARNSSANRRRLLLPLPQ